MWTFLKGAGFDVIVNLRHDWRTSLLVRLLPAKGLSIRSDFWHRWLMVNLKINKLRNIHKSDRMLQVVEPLGIKADGLGLDYFIPERDRVLIHWLPEPFQQGYVVFSINAPYATRKLPVNRLIELCDRINRPVILVGTKEDETAGETVSGFFSREASMAWEEGLVKLNKRTIVYNACGKFSFNQMASLVKQSRAVFLFDGDCMPVASAFKKEIFCLLGNTIPLFGTYPYRTKFTMLENHSLSCRPCSTRGFASCPRKHFGCMNDLVFDFYLI